MWKRAVTALPGIGVSLLPKLMCPMCWPAYAGVLSALGLGFLISTTYLLTLTVAFLALSAFALGFRASRRHGYGPFGLSLVAAVVIVTGKFYFDSDVITYSGIGMLVAASIWNSWPGRAAVVPSCCIPAVAGFPQRDLQGEQIHETQDRNF